ncbi:uncharacterized protein [Physcomitrium patens]|uniref:uncharacterized protein n=1 Tax=Physcomitrium patens TaxID=3218 RepID=UPI003CCCE480
MTDTAFDLNLEVGQLVRARERESERVANSTVPNVRVRGRRAGRRAGGQLVHECSELALEVGLTALASPSRLIIATLYCPKRRLYLSRGGFTKESHLLFDIDKKLIWHHQDNNSFGVASPSDVASSLQQG